MTKCNDSRAWHTGQCCCNCVYSAEVRKHPWNQEPFKGKISEKAGRVCTYETSVEDSQAVTWMDGKHGMCECHTTKEEIEEWRKLRDERV